MNIKRIDLGDMWANCFAVVSDKKAAVIDPGVENAALKHFADSLEEQLEYIILTHGHFDHIGGVGYLKKRFPMARVAIGREDAEKVWNCSSDP